MSPCHWHRGGGGRRLPAARHWTPHAGPGAVAQTLPPALGHSPWLLSHPRSPPWPPGTSPPPLPPPPRSRRPHRKCALALPGASADLPPLRPLRGFAGRPPPPPPARPPARWDAAAALGSSPPTRLAWPRARLSVCPSLRVSGKCSPPGRSNADVAPHADGLCQSVVVPALPNLTPRPRPLPGCMSHPTPPCHGGSPDPPEGPPERSGGRGTPSWSPAGRKVDPCQSKPLCSSSRTPSSPLPAVTPSLSGRRLFPVPPVTSPGRWVSF